MKSQQDIQQYLIHLVTTPDIDPVGFKREAVMEFSDDKTITFVYNRHIRPKRGKFKKYNLRWKPVELQREAVLTHLKSNLSRAWDQLRKDNPNKNAGTLLRILDKIEFTLWVLDDQDSIDFIRDPEKYERSVLKLITWISERYDYFSNEQPGVS